MGLSPEQVEGAQFTQVRHGYDVGEVRSFLKDVAERLRTPDDFERAGDEVASALRGLHRLLVEMKDNAGKEIEQARREAAQETERVRAEAEDDAHRLRNDAQWHHDELVREAEVKAQQLLEDATQLRSEAEGLVHAADHTVRAKRKEIDDYVVSLSASTEQIVRGRIEEVVNGHRAELRRLADSRTEAAETLRRAQQMIAAALGSVTPEVDLTDGEGAGAELGAEATEQQPIGAEELANEIAADGMAGARANIESRFRSAS